MFARIEVGIRPEFPDPAAQVLVRKIELLDRKLREKIRWARYLDVYWLDLPAPREEVIPAITEIFWDRVLQWLFTGNLIPSAAGKHGSILDLMESAPHRPGCFMAIERRFRPGVTDNVGRTAIEAFEIVLGKKFPAGRVVSGGMLLLEGAELDEDLLSRIAGEIFCNELIETWTLIPDAELKKIDRFHPERIKRDLPRIQMKGMDKVEEVSLKGMDAAALLELSKKKLWALSIQEMAAVQKYFYDPAETEKRRSLKLEHPTDVEMEVIAQTWSEHCKHKIFSAKIRYSETPKPEEDAPAIPAQIPGLFRATIAATTADLPKPWLLSVFEDNAGIVTFDDEHAICIKVETHNSPSALDPYGGALTGIVGVNRDILGCGLGAKPIFNTDVFCLAEPDFKKAIPERLLPPRRILDGVRRGVEHGGNKSGIPTLNGAFVFDERYLGKPLIYCGTAGIMPRVTGGRNCQTKEVSPGDRICMVGGRIGKDGIHGATFSSLALDENSPMSAVQLGDPITQKRAADFLLEARDMGLYRAITDNGAGGLSSSVGEMARLSNGAWMDVSRAAVKYPGLKPYELVVSESQERMTVAVPAQKLPLFLALAERRGVEVSDLGEFTDTGRFEIFHGEKRVAHLDLKFLHDGVPKLELEAIWKGRSKSDSSGVPSIASFESDGAKCLLQLLGRPNIASKEWMIRQYDHEVQGTSVIKPLHTSNPGTEEAKSGPNDAGVIKPKPSSQTGVAVGCGINPKLSDIDPYLMAQSAVDEAVRNILCVGAEFGKPESVLALVDNFCWPDPVGDPEKTACLVRACYGLRNAALELSAPLVSGKDSMKNDFRGKLDNKPIMISVPPTLLMTALGRVPDIRHARTADFKSPGDVIYLLGGARLGLAGSEFQSAFGFSGKVPGPDWAMARKTYGWLGGAYGREQHRLKSLHDLSEGGLLVTVAESLIARGFGASLDLSDASQLWEFCFGEGFHSFVASVSEADASTIEAEWNHLGIPARRIGVVTKIAKLEISSMHGAWSVDTRSLQAAWVKEGYWE